MRSPPCQHIECQNRIGFGERDKRLKGRVRETIAPKYSKVSLPLYFHTYPSSQFSFPFLPFPFSFVIFFSTFVPISSYRIECTSLPFTSPEVERSSPLPLLPNFENSNQRLQSWLLLAIGPTTWPCQRASSPCAYSNSSSLSTSWVSPYGVVLPLPSVVSS
jgi:hypothetical protein